MTVFRVDELPSGTTSIRGDGCLPGKPYLAIAGQDFPSSCSSDEERSDVKVQRKPLCVVGDVM